MFGGGFKLTLASSRVGSGEAELPRLAPSSRALRPEIQALRAIAVLAVVVYHVWPNQLPGGFVGVDVFFVISGYLITKHIVDEIDMSGGLGVVLFWSRRVRRLLPAAFVVLLASVVLLFTVLPATRWAQGLTESAASAAYVQNWVLAVASVDYLAAENDPSLFQHFWSLSVEEQFYLLWPVLIVGLLACVSVAGRRGLQLSVHGVLAVGLSAVVAASLGYSIWLTTNDPGVAYFSTATRAWEFAAGGLLALALVAWPPREGFALSWVLSWTGLSAIAVSTIAYSSSTPFPGFSALLPVVGTILVIAAGSPRRFPAPGRLLSLRPIQFLGGISYSLYLWHWPLIVVYPLVRGAEPGLIGGLSLIAIAVGLSAATKRWVEDPFRGDRSPIRSPRRAFAFAVVGATVFALVAAVGFLRIERETSDAADRALVVEDCIGVVIDEAERAACSDVIADLPVVPALAARESDTAVQYGCYIPAEGAFQTCSYGVDGAAVRIAIAGDSHAASLIPGLVVAVEQLGWSLDVFVGSGCTFQPGGDCPARAEIDRALLNGGYDAVLITSWRRYHPDAEVLAAYWEPFLLAGVPFVAVGDVPHLPEDVNACIDSSRGDWKLLEDCKTDVDKALGFQPDRYVQGADIAGIPSIELAPLLCDSTNCPAMIGRVLVYRDSPASHITSTLSRTMSEFWVEQLVFLLESEAVGSS